HPCGLPILLGRGEEITDLLFAGLDGSENGRERRLPEHHEDDDEGQGRPEHQPAAHREQATFLRRERRDRADYQKRREPQRFRGHVSDRERDQLILPGRRTAPPREVSSITATRR